MTFKAMAVHHLEKTANPSFTARKSRLTRNERLLLTSRFVAISAVLDVPAGSVELWV
jgi:hypothetical protein